MAGLGSLHSSSEDLVPAGSLRLGSRVLALDLSSATILIHQDEAQP